MKKNNINQILHHLEEHDLPYNAVSPPIFQSSIFSFDTFDDFSRAISKEEQHLLYTQDNNPTINILEKNWPPLSMLKVPSIYH
jgi:cystathionine beta-lyase/cystathionine gamma-synthase